MGSFNRTTQLHREQGGLSCGPPCPACSPWPSEDLSCVRWARTLEAERNVDAVAVDTRERREMGRGREERLAVYSLSQPHSSLDGSPTCGPNAQLALSHVRLEGPQFSRPPPARCQGLPSVLTA